MFMLSSVAWSEFEIQKGQIEIIVITGAFSKGECICMYQYTIYFFMKIQYNIDLYFRMLLTKLLYLSIFRTKLHKR